MIFLLLFAFIFLLFVYDTLGRGIKRLFNISYSRHNLLIGYLSSVTLYYLLFGFFIIKDYSYNRINNLLPLYLIINGLLVILGAKNRKSKIDYPAWIIIILYAAHFLSLDYLKPELVAPSLNKIMRGVYLSVFESYLFNLANIFNLPKTVFIVNVMTGINLVIILSTIYDLLLGILKKRKEALIGFGFFIFCLTFLNSSINSLSFSYNAYQFLYFPFQGLTVYLFAVIPFFIFMVVRSNKLPSILIMLVQFASAALAEAALFLQLVVSTGLILIMTLFPIYKLKEVIRFILITFALLFGQLLIFNYPANYQLMFVLTFIFLTGVLLIKTKYRLKNITVVLILGLVMSLFILGGLLDWRINEAEVTKIRDIYAKNLPLVLLYYGLIIFALCKTVKAERVERIYCFYLPLLTPLLIFNPVTLYFVFGEALDFTLLYYLYPMYIPLSLVFVKKAVLIEKLLIIFLIIALGKSIYQPNVYLYQTSKDPYYRISRDALLIGKYLNEHEELINLITSPEIKPELGLISTNAVIDTKDNAELTLLEFTINDKVPFDVEFFLNQIDQYDIKAIIIPRDKYVTNDLGMLCENIIEFPYYTLFVF